jgi:2-polyprenyl-6-methoxyphenol hydroxylase-like FAD-dependent oxidoreductase
MFWSPKTADELSHPASLNSKETMGNMLTRILGDAASSIGDLDAVAEDVIRAESYPVRVMKLDQYHHKAGKVVLVGDAAHLMSTALGQVSNEVACGGSVVMHRPYRA